MIRYKIYENLSLRRMKPLSETLSFMTDLPTEQRKEMLCSLTLEVFRFQSRVVFSQSEASSTISSASSQSSLGEKNVNY